MRETFGNILIVAGSGRNCGKTSFLCNIIRKQETSGLAAIKVTPHFHEPTEGLVILKEHPSYRIFKEENRQSDKDSSRYLQAGAVDSFFIQAKDDALQQAFHALVPLLGEKQPVVIESAALAKFISPSLFLFIQKEKEPIKSSVESILPHADMMIISNGESFSLSPGQLIFEETWKIRN